jgi:prevent-host-death family protein
MTTVGIRELRNNLSRYLAAVRKGEEVLVTDRGKPVARIVKEPSAKSPDREALRRLAARGLVRLPTRERTRDVPLPLELPGKPLSEIIIEDRG